MKKKYVDIFYKCNNWSDKIKIIEKTVGESFFINQLSSQGNLSYVDEGDFACRGYTFEIEGKNKSIKQIKHVDNSFVASDEIEIGHNHKIPLWLFGFLY